ncbi:MAG: alkaline phosphatase family protein [Planctomycetaceae bacterium]|nr:alkaline phosphatase family protein [Planctomycetaceae bacterium]
MGVFGRRMGGQAARAWAVVMLAVMTGAGPVTEGGPQAGSVGRSGEERREASTPAGAGSVKLPTLPGAETTLEVIGFGSCARDREPQPIWERIMAAKPQVFLFIGDNQYADFWEKDGKIVMQRVPGVEYIHAAYARLAAQSGFAQMRSTVPILATWDDHDYGDNDAGKEFPFKAESQRAFLDFWGFGPDAPQRTQEGVYQAYRFGPEGRRVQIIILDTRYHRDALTRGPRTSRPGPYVPNTDGVGTMLGEAQWAWLEAQLRQPADVRLVVTSIQVVADEHGHETWGNLPHERQRLYDLIGSTGASGVVFLSGDRHLAEISVDRGLEAGRRVPYPMWDFTSSGLNERAREVKDPNSKRIGPVLRQTNYGRLRLRWGATPESSEVEFTAHGDAGQVLTRQTVFVSDLRVKPAGR